MKQANYTDKSTSGNTGEISSLSKIYHRKNMETVVFHISEKLPSCVFFMDRGTNYIYDLSKVAHCVYSKDGTLNFTVSGRQHRLTGRAAKCLFAALLDWHERKVKP